MEIKNRLHFNFTKREIQRNQSTIQVTKMQMMPFIIKGYDTNGYKDTMI